MRKLIFFIIPMLSLIMPQSSNALDEFETFELAYVYCATSHFKRLIGTESRTDEEVVKALDSTFDICRPLIVKIREKYGDTMAVYLYVDTRSYLTFQYQLYR